MNLSRLAKNPSKRSVSAPFGSPAQHHRARRRAGLTISLDARWVARKLTLPRTAMSQLPFNWLSAEIPAPAPSSRKSDGPVFICKIRSANSWILAKRMMLGESPDHPLHSGSTGPSHAVAWPVMIATSTALPGRAQSSRSWLPSTVRTSTSGRRRWYSTSVVCMFPPKGRHERRSPAGQVRHGPCS